LLKPSHAEATRAHTLPVSCRLIGVCRNIGSPLSSFVQQIREYLKLFQFFQLVTRLSGLPSLERPLPLQKSKRNLKMLKITQQRDAESESVSFMLEGRLAGPWVEELETCWRQTAANPRSHAVVDLTGVTFVDADGKALLIRMWQQGAELRAAGCLTRCIVEEITKAGQADPSRSHRKDRREGS
jgi:anti-anti-sigma regulatory factor